MEAAIEKDLKTERLYLRERTVTLLEDIRKKSLQEQLDFFGFDSEEKLQREWNRVDKGLSNWRIEFKVWDLIELESKKVVGYFGFHSWYVWHRRAEIGAFLNEPYRKRGYMGEAMKRVIQFGFDELGLNRIEGWIRPNNIDSINMTLKLGFKEEGVSRELRFESGKFVDMNAYSLLRSDYLAWK